MKAFTWLSAYHLQGKEQWNASISSIKQRKGSTIQKSNKRGCMFSQHWMGTFSSCCWMSLSRSTIQQTRGKCPTNQCWAGFKRVFKVSGSRHQCIWKTNKYVLGCFTHQQIKCSAWRFNHINMFSNMYSPLILVKRSLKKPSNSVS